MSLQVWLPLIKDYKNYGLNTMEFSPIDSNTIISSGGKIGENCYYNNSHGAGGFISDKTLYLGDKLTMCCWVKFATLNASSALGGSMGGQHRYQNSTGMGLTFKYITATTGYFSVNTGKGVNESNRTYNQYCNSTLLNANTWYHICFTYDGSIIKFYLNGKLDGTHSFVGQVNVDDFVQIFGWSFVGTSGATIYNNYKLNGYMNDFRIYDNVLSEKELASIQELLSDEDLLVKKFKMLAEHSDKPDISPQAGGYEHHHRLRHRGFLLQGELQPPRETYGGKDSSRLLCSSRCSQLALLAQLCEVPGTLLQQFLRG